MISSWFSSRTFPRRTHVVRRSKNSKSGISFFITRSCAGRPPRVCHTQSTPWYRIIRIAANSGKHQGTLALVPTLLINRGIRVLTANGDDLTDSSDPSRVMMRQIAGAFHQYEKARLVAKLKVARDRKKLQVGKCEGRKSWAEINPQLVLEAKRLRRRSPKGHQRSLRDVAAELAKLGYLNQRGATFSAASVASILEA
jgi:hypothetical protein